LLSRRCLISSGGAFSDEFFINHLVRLLYPLTTPGYSVAPARCCSVFYKTQPIIQVILKCWLPKFILVLWKLIFVRFPPSCMLPIVYDRELEGKDDYVFHAVQRYLELVNAGLAPVSTAIMETFPFRMFALAIALWLNLNSSSSLTASYLVPWGHIQESISGMPPCRSWCEGGHLQRCQREDGESGTS
jgi:hypothetical protein